MNRGLVSHPFSNSSTWWCSRGQTGCWSSIPHLKEAGSIQFLPKVVSEVNGQLNLHPHLAAIKLREVVWDVAIQYSASSNSDLSWLSWEMNNHSHQSPAWWNQVMGGEASFPQLFFYPLSSQQHSVVSWASPITHEKQNKGNQPSMSTLPGGSREQSQEKSLHILEKSLKN